MARSTPRVEGAALVGLEGEASSIEVGSPAWYAWLEDASTFAFTSDQGSFTARKEQSGRVGWYWKAYRKHKGSLHRAYLGKSADLTLDRLTTIAADLAQHAAEPLRAKSLGATASGSSLAKAELLPAGTTSDASPSRSPVDRVPLLATKLYIPTLRPHVVPRPRLLVRLTAGLTGSLTLLAAPAGFGKTTLLAQGMGDRGWGLEGGSHNPEPLSPIPRSVAWLSLDVADNDPIRFWSYVIAALETVRPGIGSAARIALAVAAATADRGHADDADQRPGWLGGRGELRSFPIRHPPISHPLYPSARRLSCDQRAGHPRCAGIAARLSAAASASDDHSAVSIRRCRSRAGARAAQLTELRAAICALRPTKLRRSSSR